MQLLQRGETRGRNKALAQKTDRPQSEVRRHYLPASPLPLPCGPLSLLPSMKKMQVRTPSRRARGAPRTPFRSTPRRKRPRSPGRRKHRRRKLIEKSRHETLRYLLPLANSDKLLQKEDQDIYSSAPLHKWKASVPSLLSFLKK